MKYSYEYKKKCVELYRQGAKSEELIMNHYILWVTQADAAQAKKWYTFLEGYSKGNSKKRKRLYIFD